MNDTKRTMCLRFFERLFRQQIQWNQAIASMTAVVRTVKWYANCQPVAVAQFGAHS